MLCFRYYHKYLVNRKSEIHNQGRNEGKLLEGGGWREIRYCRIRRLPNSLVPLAENYEVFSEIWILKTSKKVLESLKFSNIFQLKPFVNPLGGDFSHPLPSFGVPLSTIIKFNQFLSHYSNQLPEDCVRIIIFLNSTKFENARYKRIKFRSLRKKFPNLFNIHLNM